MAVQKRCHSSKNGHTVIEPDAGGTFSGANYCFATARDWARFGLLYLNDGVWNGERILPANWVRFTMTPSTAKTHNKHGEYGALWWINSGNIDSFSGKTYPDVPANCFSCQGYFGQYVWVIPSKKLVIVKLSHEEGYTLNSNQFLAEIIRALPD